MENLDEKATEELDQAFHNVEAANKIGFRDGFIGNPARYVSLGHDQQTAYFKGYEEGSEHRRQVQEVAQAEGIGIDDLMRKAFTLYYENIYLPSKTP